MVACLESCIAHLVEDEGWITSKPLAAISASKVGNAQQVHCAEARSVGKVEQYNVGGLVTGR